MSLMEILQVIYLAGAYLFYFVGVAIFLVPFFFWKRKESAEEVASPCPTPKEGEPYDK